MTREVAHTATQVSGFGHYSETRPISDLMTQIRRHKNKKVSAHDGMPEVVINASSHILFLESTQSILNYLLHKIASEYGSSISGEFVFKTEAAQEKESDALIKLDLNIHPIIGSKSTNVIWEDGKFFVKRSFIISALSGLQKDFETKAVALNAIQSPVDEPARVSRASTTESVLSLESSAFLTPPASARSDDTRRCSPIEQATPPPIPGAGEVMVREEIKAGARDTIDAFWSDFSTDLTSAGKKMMASKSITNSVELAKIAIAELLEKFQYLENGWGFYWNNARIASPIHWSRQNIVESAVAKLKNYLNCYKGRVDINEVKDQVRSLIEKYDSKIAKNSFTDSAIRSCVDAASTILLIDLVSFYSELRAKNPAHSLLPHLQFTLLPYYYAYVQLTQPALYKLLCDASKSPKFVASVSALFIHKKIVPAESMAEAACTPKEKAFACKP